MRGEMAVWKLASVAGEESWAMLLHSSTPQTFMETSQSDSLRVSVR